MRMKGKAIAEQRIKLTRHRISLGMVPVGAELGAGEMFSAGQRHEQLSLLERNTRALFN